MEDNIKNKIIRILLHFGVKKASLFGSYARGDFDEKSDIDILIEPPKSMGISFITLKHELEDSLHKKIDLLTYNGLSPYLKKDILEQNIRII